jgi:23S rRNA (uracil1939-C5)-methyltransferase
MTTTKEARPLFNVRKNQVITVEARDYSHDAQAICRVQGLVVFVPGLMVGERAEVRIEKVLKRQAYAKVVRRLNDHPERVVPRCPLFGRCGGCQLQHFSASAQADFKQQQVATLFAHHLNVHDIAPILRMDDPWAYRNKAQVPFVWRNDQLYYGFYRAHSNDVVPMARCDIQDDAINAVLSSVRDFFNKRPADAQALRHVLVKKGFGTEALMLVIVSRLDRFADEPRLVETLQAQFPTLKAILINHNTRTDNVILTHHHRALSVESTLEDVLDGIRFRLSASSFYQVNPRQTVRLYQRALAMAQFTGHERLLDLYCGVGTIALFAASQVASVIGIEVNADAVADARVNAQLNGITNVEFVEARADQLSRYIEDIDVAIVDPPRKGLDELTLHTLIEQPLPKLIYISCNPSTLVRDLKALVHVYKIEAIQPVDMFAQTHHIEVIVALNRSSSV